MAEFSELVRFDAGIDAGTEKGPWSDIFPRTVVGNDVYNSSHQGAHAVGRDLSKQIRVYELIETVYAEFNTANPDAPQLSFAGADDISNGALLSTSARGGQNSRTAVHRGSQTKDFDAIMHSTEAGTDRYLDRIGQNMLDRLELANNLNERVAIAQEFQIKVQNYQNYATLRFLHQDVLDRMFGKDVVKSIPLNGADGRIKVAGSHDTLANREAARAEQQKNIDIDNYNNVVNNPAFKAIEEIRGNDPNRSNIHQDLIDRYPEVNRLYGLTYDMPDLQRADMLAMELWTDTLGYDASTAHRLNERLRLEIDSPEFLVERDKILADFNNANIFHGPDDRPTSHATYNQRRVLNLADEFRSRPESEADNIIQSARADSERRFANLNKIAPHLFEGADPDIVRAVQNQYDVIAAAEQSKVLSTTGKITARLGAIETILGLASLHLKYKLETREIDKSFPDWLAEKAPQFLGALPAIGILAGGLIGAAFIPIVGPFIVAGATLIGVYDTTRNLLNDYVALYKDIPDDPGAGWLPVAQTILAGMNWFEQTLVYKIVAGVTNAIVRKVFEHAAFEVQVKFNGEDGIIPEGKNIWLSGLDTADLAGNSEDNVLFHFGAGDVWGLDGNDILAAYKPDHYEIGDRIGDAPKEGFEDKRPPAEREHHLTLDGGTGQDWIWVFGGEGAVTIGGNGRDWIFNSSKDGIIFADTVDGLSPNETDLNGFANADNIWWWKDVTLMDPRENDVLQFFGYPLVGGSNQVPGVAIGPLGAFGGAGASSYIFNDYVFPQFFYAYDDINSRLYVGNRFEIFDGALAGAMVIENYDNPAFVTYGHQIFSNSGDLGMTFKVANPSLSQYNLIPWSFGAFNRFYAIIDELLTYAAVVTKIAKSLAWWVPADPLVLDLDGDGIETISIDRADVYFDVDGDFFKERTGWLDSDDGFLAYDKNKNGLIDDINELFGGVGVFGFDELATYDLNGDGVIDAADLIYSELLIWRDFDKDGVSDDGELMSLADMGIASITVDGEALDVVTPQGTTLRERGTFTWDTGQVGDAFEAIFELDDVDTQYRGETGIAEWLQGADLVNAKGYGRIADLAVDASNDFDLQDAALSAAAAMTNPDLRELRALSGDVLGQWSFALELTRELTPVLLDHNGTTTALIDRAVYVEDDAGGYWMLHSGAAILDAMGAEIARPTLEDVMAQVTGAGQAWQLEQMFSPSTRAAPLQHRSEAPYLAEIVNGRVVVLDYGIDNGDGTWRLASGNDVVDTSGAVIATPTRDDITAMTTPNGQDWRVESIDFNPYAAIEVEHIGVRSVDGIVVDYTVEVTDADGSFYVWARNLDRALELQEAYGTPRDFALRNFEVDFATLDEVNSADNSTVRVELLTPGQFHYATSLVGIDFQPQMLSARIAADTGVIDYSVNDTGRASLVDGVYVSPINGMVEMLGVVMDQYLITSRAFAVRLSLQGGLKDFARGIEYDLETDSYKATTDYELAPMFEAIFEQAPTGYDASYEYLTRWNEILTQVYPDYQVDGTGNIFGSAVTIDQKFIFQMLIPAFEKVGIDMELPAVLNRLGVDETRLVTHDATATEVDGTSGSNYFYLTGGDQTYRGGEGGDVYIVGANWGNDVIEDIDFGAADELRFTSVTSSEVNARRDGQDLQLSVDGQPDLLTVRNYFLGEFNPTYGGRTFDTDLALIVFADGVIWDPFRTAMEVSDPKDTNDIIVGSGAADVLEGGKGNDILQGSVGGDFYLFNRGDGVDTIHDNADVTRSPKEAGIDFLRFGEGITADDLYLTREGESDDLQIRLLDSDGNETSDAITIVDQFDGMRINLGGYLQSVDPGLEAIDYVAVNMIERFLFEDGTSLDFTQIKDRVLENVQTDGEDAIFGFLIGDELKGGKGHDIMVGREGADTYYYGRGDGLDVIYDGDQSPDLFGDGKDSDRLVFTDDLRWTDFDFIRDGASDTVELRVTGTNEGVILRDMFLTGPFQGYINLIDEYEFGDGTIWDYAKLAQHFLDITSTDGADVVYGWGVADTLDGGAGDDTLYGYEGSDTYIFARGYGQDVAIDTGGGNDKLELRGLAWNEVDVLRDGKDLIFRIKDTGEQLTVQDQYDRFDEQGKAIESFVFTDRTVSFALLNPSLMDVVGTNADETLYGSDFAEVMDGRGGDDILHGGSDGDTYKFDVGYGNDLIIDLQIATAWNNRPGESVKETDDRILFGDDITIDNIAFGKDGNDLVISITGHNDTLRIRNQFASVEEGIERFEFKNGDFLHISDVEERLTIADGSRGDDTIQGAENSQNVFDGRQGDDTLIGGREADTYTFGAAYDLDVIRERADGVVGAEDRIIFGSTVDPETVEIRRDGDNLIFDLGNGEDQLTVEGGLGAARVELYQFANGDVWTFEQIRDRLLEGSDGDDELIGFDDRDDVLEGGLGSDALVGGSGDDIYRIDAGWGADSILDASGVDKIVFGAGLLASDIRFHTEKGNLIIRFAGQDDSLVVFGAAVDFGDARSIESLVFDDGTVLTKENIWDQIANGWGTDGNDVIDARIGYGVTFSAGGGNDIVHLAVDSVLKFARGDGSVNIYANSSNGQARLEFTDLQSTEAVVRIAEENSLDWSIYFPGTGDQVTIHRAQDLNLMPLIIFADGVEWGVAELQQRYIESQTTQLDDRILGSKGDDTIQGGKGDDVLRGGEGDDTYVFARGDGRDVIVDTSGTNRLEIRGYLPEEVSVTRPVQERAEIVLSFDGTDDQVVLRYTGLEGVDEIVFGDGTIWSEAHLFERTTQTGGAFDDVLAGSSAGDTLIGGGGNDDLRGSAGDDTYVVGRNDGSDTIRDYADANSGTDRLKLLDYSPDQIRISGTQTDLIVNLPNGESVTLVDQRNGDSRSRIEEIEFATGEVWGLQEIEIRRITDMREDGLVVGTNAFEYYTHTKGFGSYTISDYYSDQTFWKNDRLEFTDVRSDEITVTRDDADFVIKVNATNEEIRLLNQSDSNNWGVRFFDFSDDVTFDRNDLNNIIVADQKAAGQTTIMGTDQAETYFHTKGEGSYAISDFRDLGHRESKTDRLKFVDVASDEVTITRESGHYILTINQNDEQIRLLNQSDSDEWGVKYIEFSDDVVFERDQLNNAIVADQKVADAEVIRGTSQSELYTHSKGEGSYKIYDFVKLRRYESKADRLKFLDVTSDEVTISRDGDHFVIKIKDNNEAITLLNQAASHQWGTRYVEFSDETVYRRADLAARVLEDSKATGEVVGTTANEVFIHNDGDGSYTISDSFSTNDKLVLADRLSTEVTATRVGEDLLLDLGNNEVVTIANQFAFDQRLRIEMIEFSNKETWTKAEIDELTHSPQKSTGTVTGTKSNDWFVHKQGDGSYQIVDIDANGASDVLHLVDTPRDGVVFARDGKDVTITIGNEVITLKGQLNADGYSAIETIEFSDHTTMSKAELYDLLVPADENPPDVTAPNAANTFNYALGDGSYVLTVWGHVDYVDTLNFTDINASDVMVTSSGQTIVISLPNGDALTLKDQLERSNQRGVEVITFADNVTWTRNDLQDRSVADQVALGKHNIFGSDRTENYYHALGDGSYTIHEDDYGNNDGFDTITFTDVNASDVHFSQGSDESLVISLSNGETVTVRKHFQFEFRYAVERIIFANGDTLDYAQIRDKSVADQVVLGQSTVTGTAHLENFIHNLGDGSYTINDEDYRRDTVDTLTFNNVALSEAVFSKGTDESLIVTLPNGEEVTIWNHFHFENRYTIERIIFSDGELDSLQAIRDRSVADQLKSKKSTVSGSVHVENYVHKQGDGSYTIHDYSQLRDTIDTIHFVDTNIADARLTKGADQSLVINLPNGERITIYEQFQFERRYAIEKIVFADGELNGLQEIRNRSVADQVSEQERFVDGSYRVENYYHSTGDGSYTIRDYDYHRDDVDTLEFTDVTSTQAVLERLDQNHLLIGLPNGETVTIENYFIDQDRNLIELIKFFDGVEFDKAAVIATVDGVVATEQTIIGTDGADSLIGATSLDQITGGRGDDQLSGREGDDTYIFAKGDGADIIRDAGDGTDTLLIHGYTRDEVSFSQLGRDGADLIIDMGSNGDRITIVNGLLSEAADLIERVEFADGGDVLTINQIQGFLVAGRVDDTGNVIMGNDGANTLTSGPGADVLIGQGGFDTYIYRQGDGQDVIYDQSTAGDDLLHFVDYNASDITSMALTGADLDDVVIRFGGGGDQVTIIDGLEFVFNVIETIEFADGTTWNQSDLRDAVTQFSATDGDDVMRGTQFEDVFDGGLGDDQLFGGYGNDTYLFAKGDGKDRIVDIGNDSGDSVQLAGLLSSEASVSRLFKGSDTIVLSFATSDDQITLVDMLGNGPETVEEIVFSDGVVWTAVEVRAALDNNAPVTREDGVFSVKQDAVLILDQQAFLHNDYDADGDDLMIIAVDGGAYGTAEIDGNGHIRFMPNGDYYGPAKLIYTVSDGNNGISKGVADIRITPLASARDDEGFAVAEDGYLTIDTTRLLSNDLDGDRMVLADVIDAQNGSAHLLSNGQIAFSPNADFNGLAQFTYVANTPEGGRAEAIVYINVLPENDGPVAANDAGYEGYEDTAFTISMSDLLRNDTDIDGDRLDITSVLSSPDLQVSLTDDGYVLVDPNLTFFGDSYFEYEVTDATGATDIARVNVTINPVTGTPEPQPDTLSVMEDNFLLVSAAELLANDLEPDGDTLTILSVSAAVGGRVELNEDQTVLFTPARNFAGEGRFTYTVDDGQGGQASTTVTVDVTGTNDAPIAAHDSYGMTGKDFLRGTENTPIEIAIADLLANDGDPEGDAIKIETVSGALNGDLVITDHGTIIFTPDPDFVGVTSFNYTISDVAGLVGGTTVSIYFDDVTDIPPVAVTDTIVVTEDISQVIRIADLLANDTDADGDAVSFVSFREPYWYEQPLNGTVTTNNDGDLVFTPDLNADESFGFYYTITDGKDGTTEGFVDIEILGVNDDPIAGNDVVTATFLDVPLVLRIADLMVNDADVEANGIDFGGITQTSAGTIEVYDDEFVIVRFDPGFSGQVDLTYLIADPQGLTDEGYITTSVANSYDLTQMGSQLRDLLLGNAQAETFTAGAGNDDIVAGAGADTIYAGTGDDVIVAGAGDDLIDGGAGIDDIDAGEGDDLIRGGDGFDNIDGGAGFDTVDFKGSNVGVTVNLDARIGQGGFAQGDVYTNIEAILGTRHADDLSGDAANNLLDGRAGNDQLDGRAGDDILVGGAGDDFLTGGAGADILEGGAGNDTVDYFLSADGVNVSLAANTTTGGDATGDTISGFENIGGSEQNDQLIGDDGDNLLRGRAGDDVIVAGGGNDTLVGGTGADLLDGGDGVDIADYSGSADPVTINMADGSASGGDAAGDTFTNIEIVQASGGDDTIIGDGADNIIRGGRGADMIDGGAGFDTADYSAADTAVAVNLATGRGTAGEANGDTLSNIEKLVGSNGADSFVGSAADEVFDGGFGNDLLAGGAGSDTYLFGFDSTNDTITENGLGTDIDRIKMLAGVATKDVSLQRVGDDLVVSLEQDDGLLIDTVRVTDHFVGTETGIEEIVFETGITWDRAFIDGALRDDQFNAQNDIYLFGVEDEEAIINASDLLENDAEGGAAGLTIVSVQNAVNGAVTLNDDGTISFTGAQDFNSPFDGEDAYFDYTARDQFGRESTATVRVYVDPRNDAPVAANDGVIQGTEDQGLRISLAQLLGNDVDVDGDSLRIIDLGPLKDAEGNALYAGPLYRMTNGRVESDGDDIIFLPRPDHVGFAGFTYTVTDGNGGTSTGEVELFFNAVNDGPRSGLDNATVRLSQNVTFSQSDLMANDFDLEGNAFSFVSAHSAVGGVLETDPTTGDMTFTPDVLGKGGFSYDLIDEFGATSTVEVIVRTVPLNDAPIANGDQGFETIEDQVITIDPQSLLANDSDPNGDLLIVSDLQQFPENGTVRFDDNGMIAFTPGRDFNGQTGFTYQISDGNGGFDEAFVSVTVLPENDAPVLFDDVVTGLEDEPITLLPGTVFGNDYDLEGDVLFFEGAIVLGVLNQEFGNRSEIETSFELSADKLDASVTAEATLADGSALPDWLSFDAATFALSGTPPAGDTNPVAVSVTLTHPGNPAQTFTADVIVDPVAATVRADTDMAVFDVSNGSFAGRQSNYRALPEWLSFDPATMTLSRTDVTPDQYAEPTRIVIEFMPDQADVAGIYQSSDGAFALEFLIDPNADLDPAINAMLQTPAFFGAQGLFAVPVGGVTAAKENSAGLPDWMSFDPDTLAFTGTPPEVYVGAVPVRLDVAANAEVPAFSILTDVVVDDQFSVGSTNGIDLIIEDAQRIVLNAEEDFNGSFAISYTATDDKDGVSEEPAIIVVNVLAQPETPDAEDDTFAGIEDEPLTFTLADLLINDVDDDGDTIRVLSVETPEIGTLDINLNSLTIPVPASLPVIAGGTYGAALANGDALPTWLAIDAVTGAMTATVPMDVLQSLDIIVSVTDGTLTETASVSQLFDGNDGVTLIYTPRAASSDPVEFSYTITDDAQGNGEAKITITLDAINDPPEAVIDMFTGTEFTPLTLTFDQLLANDTDVDNNPLTLTSVLNGQNGTVAIVNGAIVFSPDYDWAGIASFEYRVTDGLHGTSTGTVQIDVASTNVAPTAVPDHFTVSEDVPFVITPADLTANDTDLQADDVVSFVSIDSVSASGQFAMLPNGNIQLLSEPDFHGEVTYTYTVSDGRDESTGAFTVVFTAENDAPIVFDEADLQATEDQDFVIDLSALLINDHDVEGDALTITRVYDGVNGTVEMIGETAVFKARADYVGNAGFSYVVQDANGAETVGFAAITVNPVADLPVALDDSGYVLDDEGKITVNVADLLANDYDPDGTQVSFVGFEASLYVTDLGQGLFEIDMGAGATGATTLAYQIVDGSGATAVGSVRFDAQGADQTVVASQTAMAMAAPSSADVVRVNEDTELSMVLPLDWGDSPTMSVTRPGGAALPGWLSFDAASRTMQGTPPRDFNGVIALELATESGPRAFDLVVDAINDTPRIIAPFSDRFATEDQSFSLTLQSNLIRDVDGDAISYAVALQDGSALPNWLSFDPDTLTLTGTPPADFDGKIALQVTASDGQASVSDVFDLTISDVNDAPALLTPLDDLTTDSAGDVLLTGRPFTINVPTDHFEDVDGDQLAFASTLADGSALPDWLTFNGTTYSGQAPFDAAGSYDIILRASDGLAEASDVFTLTIGQGTQELEARNDGGFTVAAPNVLDIDLTTLLANDSNVDPDTVALVAVTNGANGRVQVTDDYVSYIPELDFRGTDQFTYTIGDGTNTSTATVSVTVSNPILDALEQQGGAALFDPASIGQLTDSAVGTSGNDRMIGNAGSDTFEGGAGNDLLRGGNGSDNLRGGTGDDVLFGGGGRDNFYFAEGDGSDRIYDFDVARAGRRSFIAGDEIKLNVSDIDSFDDLVAIGSDQDGGVLFDFGNGDELFLAGTQLAALDKDQFSFY